MMGVHPPDQSEEKIISGVLVITFSAMCLEAFLYDYAATELKKSYVDSHLDRLNITSKALIYPKLICGKTIDKQEKIFKNIKQLIKVRNKLAHFKSNEFDPNNVTEIENLHNSLNEKIESGVNVCLDTIESFARKLDEFHGTDDKYYRSVCVWS